MEDERAGKEGRGDGRVGFVTCLTAFVVCARFVSGFASYRWAALLGRSSPVHVACFVFFGCFSSCVLRELSSYLLLLFSFYTAGWVSMVGFLPTEHLWSNTTCLSMIEQKLAVRHDEERERERRTKEGV
jgi:hypothetical protein